MTRTISAELYKELSERQDELEDEAEAISEAIRIVSSALRGERSAVVSEIARVRKQKKGVESPQLELAGASAGQRKTEPLVVQILKWTEKARAAAEEAEHDREPVPEKNGKATQISIESLAHEAADARQRHLAKQRCDSAIHEEHLRLGIPAPEKQHHRGPGRPRKAKAKASPAELEEMGDG